MGQYIMPLVPTMTFQVNGMAMAQVSYFEERMACDLRLVQEVGCNQAATVHRGAKTWVLTLRRCLPGITPFLTERLRETGFTLVVQLGGNQWSYTGCEVRVHRLYAEPEKGLVEEAEIWAKNRTVNSTVIEEG